MKWYDILSNVYDTSLEKLYAASRIRAIELLDLQPGQTTIDIECGTGANFKHIKATNTDLAIYGTDFSEGMLNKAQQTLNKNNWTDVTLFQSDARELTHELIKNQLGKELQFDRVICFLGLSVIPD